MRYGDKRFVSFVAAAGKRVEAKKSKLNFKNFKLTRCIKDSD